MALAFKLAPGSRALFEFHRGAARYLTWAAPGDSEFMPMLIERLAARREALDVFGVRSGRHVAGAGSQVARAARNGETRTC